MIKALFLIFNPDKTWNRIALSQRGLGFIVGLYLLPMMLIVGVAETFGLARWGRWQPGMGAIKIFPMREALVAEAAEMLLMAVIILAGAYFVKALGDTIRVRNTYAQALTVVVYGLSPVFLLRLLDLSPTINLWAPWIIGIMLSIKILYSGVPRIMLPDPPDAFGLYFMSALLLTMVSGVERFITNGYLTGRFRPVGDVISHIAAKLHL
jgi:hypothetical protein